MKAHQLAPFAGASLAVLALATAAHAQPATAAPAQAEAAPAEATLGEIVVTARRRSESLQEVPQTVNAVTSDTLQKLNIKQFEDIQKVVPGLSLQASSTGFSAASSLRGVTYDNTTSAQPTVAHYVNDAPVWPIYVFQSLFDIGQVEVLKGPQGTTRGVSAPSGAITITTHKPDLSEFGGYGDVTLTDRQGRNIQGALNVPIIKDMLAVRGAFVFDQNDYDGVRSLHNSLRPQNKTAAERISVSFEPNDSFNANLMYQHLDHDLRSFQQVSGPGPGAITYPTAANATPAGFPASVNPAISPDDRLSVIDGMNRVKQHFDLLTAQIDSRIFGQHLSYIGSYQLARLDIESPQDIGNVLPGIEIYQYSNIRSPQTTHEIRLASDPAPGRFFDYTVGAFYNWQSSNNVIVNPGPLLNGAFGTVPGINFGAFNPAYQVPILITGPSATQETSLFGSVTLHLGDKTELSGGIRHIWSIASGQTLIQTGDGLISLTSLGLPASLPCSLLGGTTGPATGSCLLNTASVAGNFTTHTSETPNIYNVSLSHHFTRDFLVYVNTGTAFRPPVTSIGLQGAIVTSPDPALNSLTNHPAERSRAYEAGFKSTWLDGRARLNVALFRQRFTNMTIFIPGVTYFNTVTNTTNNFGMTASVDALVQGFDVDTAFQITPDWNVSAQMSYADGKIEGSQVPCNVPGAALGPSNLISFCPGGSSSRLPYWNATFQTEYVHPVFDNTDGFIRVLATYYPQNKNRVEPNFTVDNYSLVNLYLGLRSHDGAWEASIFARNAFNTQRALDVQSIQADLNSPLSTSFPSLVHPSGYYQTSSTPRREVGINVHYAFGSR